MYNVYGWLLNDPEYNKYVEVIRRNFLIIHMFICVSIKRAYTTTYSVRYDYVYVLYVHVWLYYC